MRDSSACNLTIQGKRVLLAEPALIQLAVAGSGRARGRIA